MQSGQTEYPVPWRTKEYVDVAARARELGCPVPVGVALLPGNFATAVSRAEFRYHEIAPQVRQAWRGIGLIDTGPGWKLRPKATTAAPDGSGQDVPLAVFFGVDLASDPARPVLHSLSMVATVLIAGSSSANAREIRFDGIVERPSNGGYVCLEFRGQPRELIALAKPVRDIWFAGLNASTSQGARGLE
jgi:hypothetical protein